MSTAVVIVCANLSVDRTVRVARLKPGTVQRGTDVAVHAGGKGLNVARNLAELGVPSVTIGFAAGRTGTALRELAADSGLDLRTVDVPGETRSCVTILDDDGVTTVLNEPGPHVDEGDWTRLEQVVGGTLGSGDLLVVSGSNPPGSPEDGVARLVHLAHERGCAALVDTSGSALLLAVTEGPELVVPNIEEARAVLGGAVSELVAVEDPDAIDDAVRAARLLRDRGAMAALVTVGKHGVVVDVPGTGAAHVRAPQVKVINPVGAGDALVAGLVASVRDGDGLRSAIQRGTGLLTAVRSGVAAASASVEAPAAGNLDPARMRMLLAEVVAWSVPRGAEVADLRG
jgi:1-phosphofructokinase family hexose kinase